MNVDAKQAKEHLSEISYCDSMEPGYQIETVLLHPDHAKEIAALVERQEKTITDLQQRLRELDERNQTQAQVLAARDRIIERQENMIEDAIEQLCVLDCPRCMAETVCDPKSHCRVSWRKWLEEAGE